MDGFVRAGWWALHEHAEIVASGDADGSCQSQPELAMLGLWAERDAPRYELPLSEQITK